MLGKDTYANGQKAYELKNNKLTYYYKSGKIRAEGPYLNEMFEGEWKFWRESGQLWEIGHFKNNLKHGSWVRWDINDNVEYDETFVEGKIVRKKNGK